MAPFLQRQYLTVGVAVVVLASTTRGAADTNELGAAQVDGIRIEYRAPPECPPVEVFKGLVSSRLTAPWEAEVEAFARRFLVQVSSHENNYVATLELEDERGERGVKRVTGARCEDVVNGIALVTALAIQSRGTDEPTAEPVAPVPLAEPAATVDATASTAPDTPRGAPPTPVVSRPMATEQRPQHRLVRDVLPSTDLRLSARASLTTGIGPRAAPGLGLGVVLERRAARLGLALQAYRTARIATRGVSAQFQLLSARIEGCPFALVLATWASVEPCVFAEVGAITGEAFDAPPKIVRGDRGTAPWYSGGGVGRAVGRFGWLVVEVEALVGAPLRRERFYVERGEEIYRVPAYHARVSMGLGVRF